MLSVSTEIAAFPKTGRANEVKVMTANNDSWQVTLSQLIRLRWLAILGQASAVVICTLAGITLPLKALIVFIVLAAISNFFLAVDGLPERARGERRLALAIVMDVILVTAMLYWSGGVHNPFTSFYLLQLVIGALTLETATAWAITGLCVVGFSLLFLSPHPLFMPHTQFGQITFNFHMEGMFVAFILTGAFITYFVTKLRRALRHSEEQLARSRELAQRAERLASLATLAAGVAHELATPLSTISVLSHNWNVVSPADVSRYAADGRVIAEQVERCQMILGKLNRSSTDGIGETPQLIGLSKLLNCVLQSLPARQRERLLMDNGTREIELFVPKDSVTQAIATLIKNACEAEGSEGPVRLSVRQEAGKLLFRVKDSGAGMPPEILSHLGEPFFTTKAPGKGMGLGLFLVRILAERLGGSLDIASSQGQGSEFTFWLSLANN